MNNTIGKKIPLYVLRSILPYFISSWAFLTVILFIQQASRYSEIFFNPNISPLLVWQMTFALLPNVIAFTSPMSALISILVGLAKMEIDGELTAIRASGISNAQMFLPIAAFGFLLSIFSFLVNWKGVPIASRAVRQVVLKSALEKLNSPIEAGIFNTEIPSVTIYVGSVDRNVWNDVIIFEERSPNTIRLITGEEGKIKITSDLEQIQISLENVEVIALFPKQLTERVSIEKVSEISFTAKTKKQEILERVKKDTESLEELGMEQLLKMSREKTGKERTETQILFNRRILLSISPLLFSILGFSISAKTSKGGKGKSLAIAFIILTVFYLAGLLGEQLVRTGHISANIATLMPVILAVIITAVIPKVEKRFYLRKWLVEASRLKEKTTVKIRLIGSFDREILKTTTRLFLSITVFLIAIYMIFTAFELWKFAGTKDNGMKLLLEYLVNLTPYVYLQLAPSCLAAAILTAFTIKSRQNEIVAWISAGKSVYRLVAPCFALGLAIGIINWIIQETIAPHTNKHQDMLRAELRSKSIFATGKERIWVIENNKIYSMNTVKNDYTYIFEKEGSKIKSITVAEYATLEGSKIFLRGNAEKIRFQETDILFRSLSEEERIVKETPEIIQQIYSKPSHLKTSELKERISKSPSESERQIYKVALEKRYLTVFLPLIACIVMVPFSFSPEGKKSPQNIGYATLAWLLFIWISSFLEQMGASNALNTKAAVWISTAAFTAFGIYMLSKAKT